MIITFFAGPFNPSWIAFHLSNRDNPLLHRDRILVQYTCHSHIDIFFMPSRETLLSSITDRSLIETQRNPNHIPMFHNRVHRHRYPLSDNIPCASLVAIGLSLRMFDRCVIDVHWIDTVFLHSCGTREISWIFRPTTVVERWRINVNTIVEFNLQITIGVRQIDGTSHFEHTEKER